MALSNTELANKISDLIDRWQTYLDQWFNWQGGDPSGGPNNDGKYPLSDATGTTELYSSIPKLQQTLSTLETEGESAVNQAEAAEKTASEYATLATGTVTDYDPVNGNTDTGDSSAKQHADAASSSASTAQTAESGALTAETDAQSARDAAQTAETGAQSAESSAVTAKDQAETAESGAQTAESNASTSANNAATSETNAAASETDAGEHETTAQRWANEAQGVTVVNADTGQDTGEYSAYHYKKEAQATLSEAMVYEGSWDASTGSYPTSPSKGSLYKVSVAGTVDGVEYKVGDSIIHNGGDATLSSGWDHVDNTESVTSVAGKVGDVSVSKGDVGLPNVPNTDATNAGNISSGTLPDARIAQTGVTQHAGALTWTNLGISKTDVSASDVNLGNVPNSANLSAFTNDPGYVDAPGARSAVEAGNLTQIDGVNNHRIHFDNSTDSVDFTDQSNNPTKAVFSDIYIDSIGWLSMTNYVDMVDSVSAIQNGSFSTDYIHLTGYNSGSTEGGGHLYYDSSDTTTADNGVTVFVDSDSKRWKRIIGDTVYAEWAGLTDGNDETSRLETLLSEATGKTLHLGGNATYGFSTPLSVGNRTRIENPNRVMFEARASLTNDNSGITFGTQCSGDYVILNIAAGYTFQRFVEFQGSGEFDYVKVTSDDQQTAKDDNQDGIVQFRGDDLRIGRLEVNNCDYAAVAYTANRLFLGYVEITDYRRGLKLENSDNVTVTHVNTYSPSPNATTSPGDNGILVEDCKYLAVHSASVVGAGEHGIRVGGGDGESLAFSNIRVASPGQCGFKVNPAAGTLIRGLQINGLIVSDPNATTDAGPNEDGLRIEKARYVEVSNFGTYQVVEFNGGYYGLYLNDVSHSTFSNLRIEDTYDNGIHLDTLDGRISDIAIHGAVVKSAGNHAVYFDSSNTNGTTSSTDNRHVIARGLYLDSPSNDGVHVDGGSDGYQPWLFDGYVRGWGGSAFTNDTGSSTNIFDKLDRL